MIISPSVLCIPNTKYYSCINVRIFSKQQAMGLSLSLPAVCTVQTYLVIFMVKGLREVQVAMILVQKMAMIVKGGRMKTKQRKTQYQKKRSISNLKISVHTQINQK